MGTYSEIQTRVQRIVIDLPSAVTTEVPGLINKAMKELQMDHNFKVMEALSGPNQTTADSHTLLTVPSNFKEYRGEPYFITDAGDVYFLTVTDDRTSIFTSMASDEEGEPRILLDGEPSTEAGARSWEIWPLPVGDSDFDNGEYRVYIPYWKYLTALSADADTNWFTVNAEQYLVEKAAAMAFALDWDAAHESEHLQLAEMEKKLVIRADKMYRLSRVSTLIPHYRGVFAPRNRRK